MIPAIPDLKASADPASAKARPAAEDAARAVEASPPVFGDMMEQDAGSSEHKATPPTPPLEVIARRQPPPRTMPDTAVIETVGDDAYPPTGPIEHASVEYAPVERASVEHGTVERASVERGPDERGPVERGPAGRAAVERASVAHGSAGNSPIEHISVEQEPTEAQKAPVETIRIDSGAGAVPDMPSPPAMGHAQGGPDGPDGPEGVKTVSEEARAGALPMSDGDGGHMNLVHPAGSGAVQAQPVTPEDRERTAIRGAGEAVGEGAEMPPPKPANTGPVAPAANAVQGHNDTRSVERRDIAATANPAFSPRADTAHYNAAPLATAETPGTTSAQISAQSTPAPTAPPLGAAMPFSLSAGPDAAKPQGGMDIALEAGAGLVARGVEPGADTRSTPAPVRPMTVQGTDAVHEIVRATLAAKGPSTIELRLDPSELGQLDIELSFNDERVSIIVRADNQDALDLMRRSSDDLMKMLRGAGLDLDTLAFSHGQAGDRERGDSGNTLSFVESGIGDGGTEAQPVVQRLASRDRVDIRI